MSENKNNNNDATVMIGVAGGSCFATALIAESPFLPFVAVLASAAIIVRPVANLCNNALSKRREQIALQHDAVRQLESTQTKLIELSDYQEDQKFLQSGTQPEVSFSETLEEISETLKQIKQ